MAEYVSNPIQLVEVGGNILLDDSISCPKGYVLHRQGAGVFTLRGSNANSRFARYQVECNCNIAVPEDGEADEISIAISLDGEPIQSSRARVTPTVVDAYFNVTSFAQITVPSCCCQNIAIENLSDQAINVQNVNLTITRIA